MAPYFMYLGINITGIFLPTTFACENHVPDIMRCYNTIYSFLLPVKIARFMYYPGNYRTKVTHVKAGRECYGSNFEVVKSIEINKSR